MSASSDTDTRYNPRLSFVIPWCNRAELEICLAHNRDTFIESEGEVVVVNFGGDPQVCTRICEVAGVPRMRVVQCPEAQFNKCSSLNLGIYYSQSDTIFLLDCDVVIARDLVDLAFRHLSPTCFVTVKRGRETAPARHFQTLHSVPWLSERSQTTSMTFLNGTVASFEFCQSQAGRTLAGLMMIDKKHFLAVNGCNGDLTGWGFEDYDLQIRLQASLGLTRVSVGGAEHITHESAAPERRAAENARNIQVCFERYSNSIFSGTFEQDVSVYVNKTTVTAFGK